MYTYIYAYNATKIIIFKVVFRINSLFIVREERCKYKRLSKPSDINIDS